MTGLDWSDLGVGTRLPKGKCHTETTSACAKAQTAGAEHWAPSRPHLWLSLDCGLASLQICCWCAPRRFASQEPTVTSRAHRVAQIRMLVNNVHFLSASRFTWETKWQSESVTRSMGPEQEEAPGQHVRSPPRATEALACTAGSGLLLAHLPSSSWAQLTRPLLQEAPRFPVWVSLSHLHIFITPCIFA